MEAAQARVQDNVNKLLGALDKEHLRRIQGDTFRCSAKCTDDMTYSMEDVQRCLDRCSTPAVQAQSFVAQEMEAFQGRLQRCAMDCQDRARDKVSATSSAAEVDAAKKSMEGCMVKCADTHIELIPGMLKRMREVLAATKLA